jgi:hypothetical protein
MDYNSPYSNPEATRQKRAYLERLMKETKRQLSIKQYGSHNVSHVEEVSHS